MREQLQLLAKRFIAKELSIQEFQERLSTIQCDSKDEQLEIELLDNQLEEIVFCANPNDYYIQAKELLKKYMA